MHTAQYASLLRLTGLPWVSHPQVIRRRRRHLRKRKNLPWEAQHFRADKIVTVILSAAAAAGLGAVVALAFDAVEVLAADIAGDVLAVEAGTIEVLDLGVALARGFDQVGQVLVNELIGADDFRNLVFGAAVADQFLARRHV